MSIKRYSELKLLPTFEERFKYLKLDGTVGEDIFGYYRFLNQAFYQSTEWRRIRDIVITRDNGCDLGIDGRYIFGSVFIHHLNPITISDIRNREEWIRDPEFLISTTKRTHLAIHYGDASLLVADPITRSANDTCPWKH